MTPELLMKPRYKVIADYPKSPFDVGMILTKSGGTNNVFTCEQAIQKSLVWHPENYPVIFQELMWWEGRTIDEMPEYVKQSGMVDSADNPVPDWYVKVKKHFNAGNGEWRDDSINIFCTEDHREGWSPAVRSMNYSGFEPATESEYNTFIESKK